jgi:hypothetical protein
MLKLRKFSRLMTAGTVGVCLVLLVPGPDIETAAATDNLAPVVTSMTFSPSTIDISGPDPTVHVTATATDDLIGVGAVHVWIESPTGSMEQIDLFLTAGDELDGTWEGQFTFNPLVHENGVWVVTRLFAGDLAGNQVVLGTDEIVAAGYPTELTISSGATPYDVEAFAAPIDNGVTNVARAGRTIPVKWNVSLDAQFVSDPAHFVSITSATAARDDVPVGTDTIEVYSGSSGLQYLGDGYWQFNWKTLKAYQGQTRIMTLTLDDGSTYSAVFVFR